MLANMAGLGSKTGKFFNFYTFTFDNKKDDLKTFTKLAFYRESRPDFPVFRIPFTQA